MNSLIARAVAVVVVGIVVAVGYRACSQPKAIPNPFDKGSRAYEPFAAFAKRLSANQSLVSKLNARVRTAADPKTLGFELAESGMRRLDNASIERRMVLALKLVEFVDTSTCAAMARADTERSRAMLPKILKAIEQLPTRDIEDYMALVEKALIAEVDNVPPPPFSPAQAEPALLRLVNKFNEQERGVILRVINFPSVTTEDTSCWVVKTVFSEILALPTRDRQLLARLFAAPGK